MNTATQLIEQKTWHEGWQMARSLYEESLTKPEPTVWKEKAVLKYDKTIGEDVYYLEVDRGEQAVAILEMKGITARTTKMRLLNCKDYRLTYYNSKLWIKIKG